MLKDEKKGRPARSPGAPAEQKRHDETSGDPMYDELEKYGPKRA
jgi:hypothetical protein